MNRKQILVAAILCFSISRSFAEPQPADCFTDGMVLQRDMPVAIWGSAEPGEKVTVAFAGQEKHAKTDASGKWMIQLDPMPASAESRSLQVSSPTTDDQQPITLHDVVIGEVWLAGGQSNMEWLLRNAKKAPDVLPTLNNPQIRFYTVPRYEGFEMELPPPSTWLAASGKAAGDFSAVAYFFAADLQERLGIPVGVINCNLGASACEAWMSAEQLRKYPSLAYLADDYDSLLEKYDADAVHAYAKKLGAWKKADPETRGPYPQSPPNPYSRRVGTALHRTMLSHLIPYTMRGVIWYQGESNTREPKEYRTLFPALIKSWRQEFQNPDMPFYFVQLSTFESFIPGNRPVSGWPELRDAQLHTWRTVPNTGMASAIDWGEQFDIHPKHKQPIGERIALFARRDCYGEPDLCVSGPIYRSFEKKDGAIVISFDHLGKGLEARGALDDFEICGEDGNFQPADARIVGDTVVVSSDDIASPVSMRYGWKYWFIPSLFNANELPASPFQTAEYKLIARGAVE